MTRASALLLLAPTLAQALSLDPDAQPAVEEEPPAAEDREPLALGERPRGARRRAQERAERARLMAATATTTTPPPVFCPAYEASGNVTLAAACQRQSMEQLLSAFHTVYSQQVAAAFEGSYIGTYLTIGDGRSSPFFGNWMAHAKLMVDTDEHGHMNVVNVALDKGGMDACENIHRALGSKGRLSLSCVSLAGWLPAETFQGEARPGTCENNLMLWTKPHILKSAVAASVHPVLLVDTDVILYRDLLSLGSKLLAESSGLKQMVAGLEGNGLVNTGAVFATKASVALLLQWAEQANRCLNGKEADKAALQHVIFFTKNPTVEAFPTNDLGHCMKKGRFATHYNCAFGKKLAMIMKGMQNWADGISTVPEELITPGQLISLRPPARR